jgi:RNA polymerase sigma-70 factor (ECF subfamily)
MSSTPFEHLLAAHSPRAHRAALGLLGDEQEAREIAQEALLRAHRARDRYDTTRPFYPWLYRIVKNACLDARARGRHRAVPGLRDERISAPLQRPGESIDQARAIQRMRTALQTLTDGHREIIALRHFQDLSYAEIASILQVKEGTVMSRLFRARRALAAAMEKTR